MGAALKTGKGTSRKFKIITSTSVIVLLLCRVQKFVLFGLLFFSFLFLSPPPPPTFLGRGEKSSSIKKTLKIITCLMFTVDNYFQVPSRMASDLFQFHVKINSTVRDKLSTERGEVLKLCL